MYADYHISDRQFATVIFSPPHLCLVVYMCPIPVTPEIEFVTAIFSFCEVKLRCTEE